MLDLKTNYRKNLVVVCLKAFPQRFKNVPTLRALEILVKLGHGSECVWWVSYTDPAKRYTWTVKQLLESSKISDAFPVARAFDNLKFYGGPPGRLRSYKSTLLALFMDRLLCVVARGGFNALDAVVPLSEAYPT